MLSIFPMTETLKLFTLNAPYFTLPKIANDILLFFYIYFFNLMSQCCNFMFIPNCNQYILNIEIIYLDKICWVLLISCQLKKKYSGRTLSARHAKLTKYNLRYLSTPPTVFSRGMIFTSPNSKAQFL